MCSKNTHASQAKINKNQEQEELSKNKHNPSRTKAKNQPQAQDTQDLPCFGALEEGNTPTAALA